MKPFDSAHRPNPRKLLLHFIAYWNKRADDLINGRI